MMHVHYMYLHTKPRMVPAAEQSHEVQPGLCWKRLLAAFPCPFDPSPVIVPYCWWKKSCTSWWVVYPSIYKVFLHPRWCRISEPSTAWCHMVSWSLVDVLYKQGSTAEYIVPTARIGWHLYYHGSQESKGCWPIGIFEKIKHPLAPKQKIR